MAIAHHAPDTLLIRGNGRPTAADTMIAIPPEGDATWHSRFRQRYPNLRAARRAGHTTVTSDDPLPSWHEGAAKESIVNFMRTTTDAASPNYVRPEDRIATFDNDGTLWSEQPYYFQFAFALDQIRAMAPQHPEWRDKEPFKSALGGDARGIADRRPACAP